MILFNIPFRYFINVTHFSMPPTLELASTLALAHVTHAGTTPTSPKLARHPRQQVAHTTCKLLHPRYLRQHATHASTPPTLELASTLTLAHVTHAGTIPTSPTLASRPHKHANYSTHVTYASMPPTLARHPCYPRQQATHSSTLAGYPRKHFTCTTHASMPPTPPTLTRIARYFSNS